MVGTRLRQVAHLSRGAWPGRIHAVDTAYALFSGWKFAGGWGDEAVLGRFEGTSGFELKLEPLLPTFADWRSAGGGRERAHVRLGAARQAAALRFWEVRGGEGWS